VRVTLCVDALEPQPGGIGRYTWELCKGLRQHSGVSPLFFAGDQLLEEPGRLLIGGKRSSRRGLWARTYGRWRAREALRNTLVHSPNYFLPAHVETGIITVHDLSVFRYPELHPAARVRDFERNLQRSIDKACHLITDCDTIRREVMEFAAIPPERVTAIPLGVSESFRPVPLERRGPALERYGLPDNGYGLTLSTLEPRKRIDRLLSAWRRLPRSVRDRFPLAIGGAAGWNNEALHAQIQDAAAEGWLIPLGYIAEWDLPAIYSGARVFAYPSVYEGFGLPPLEAMASGTPTVIAAGSCLTEVTKGAAIAANPDDIEGFAQTLLRALVDDQWRSEAISAGIQVATRYTWTRCVAETIAIYQRVNSGLRGEQQ
jgi:alpha-1,3-rhamnosyl/mannosyltransferase